MQKSSFIEENKDHDTQKDNTHHDEEMVMSPLKEGQGSQQATPNSNMSVIE